MSGNELKEREEAKPLSFFSRKVLKAKSLSKVIQMAGGKRLAFLVFLLLLLCLSSYLAQEYRITHILRDL